MSTRLLLLVISWLSFQLPLTQAQQSLPALEDVQNWLYIINVDLTDEDLVGQIVDSEYDMVVLDFATSVVGDEDLPLADIVARLHQAPHPKLVMAYIDIGQAEDFRTYWRPEWRIGAPEWILGTDPEGWDGDYPIAYWYDEWRAIWLEEGGYLDQIVAAGFDGVYLDWINGYDDGQVMAFAEEDGVDPRQEMVWWVEDIADYLRSYKDDFIVIGQNALELVEDEDYIASVDAVAQEHVWYDGGVENQPPGDCPLPRTEAEVDSAAYVASLSEVCRAQWEREESTLHSSSEQYIYYLKLALEKGLTVFTIDYALEEEHIAEVYTIARSYGFIPFVTTRNLDRFIAPYE